MILRSSPWRKGFSDQTSLEEQMTKIENDVDGMKNIIKKIRQSNGTTEQRLDQIELLSNTIQKELYLTIDMIKCISESESSSNRTTTSTIDTTITNNNTTTNNTDTTTS